MSTKQRDLQRRVQDFADFLIKLELIVLALVLLRAVLAWILPS